MAFQISTRHKYTIGNHSENLTNVNENIITIEHSALEMHKKTHIE